MSHVINKTTPVGRSEMASLSLMRWGCFSRTSARLLWPPIRAVQPRMNIHTPLPHLSLRSFILSRGYQQLAQVQRPSANPSPVSPNPEPTPERELSTSEQRRNDWAIIKRLLIHIWPKDDWGVRGRVMLGLGLLIVGKVCLRES